MSIGEMFGQSGLLTLLGMSVVFAFLIVMVLVMDLVKAAVRALKLDGDVDASSR
jgi:oxaloacetate decarboxylase gamma subunit